MKNEKIKLGDKVQKKSRKPFKSGKKINTVKHITTNPYSNRTAFSFDEDDSIVDAYQCIPSQGVEI
jgi:hypothetical protein